jgi:sterol 22-desaturase
MEVNNTVSSGFTSIIANTKYANVNIPPQIDYVVDAISNAGIWTLLLTAFLMCVVYDQSA